MADATLLWALLLVPAAASGGCELARGARAALAVVLAGVGAGALLAVAVGARVFSTGPIFGGGGWLFADALSAVHLLALYLVFSLAAVFSWAYFGTESRRGLFDDRDARRFGSLFCGSLAAMTLVLLSNNLGVLWVGVEASTLLTAFLICVRTSPAALEAMWKYLLLCSVGVAFAFMGTLLVAAAAPHLHPPAGDALLWTRLREVSSDLNPKLAQAGFVFLLVGYGTKAGLAPMHTWLPDAHSQAPAPVSAVFSGIMLSTALYAILRYVPLVEAATGGRGWALSLLRLFGLASIAVAAAFIIFQRDVKRLLAYSSVEHIGVAAVGFGLGPAGAFAALLHTLGHSAAKTLAFCAAGRLGQIHGTHEIGRLGGALAASGAWGAGLWIAVLALLGAAPSVLFLSEFGIARAAAARGEYGVLAVYLLGLSVVFVSLLRHAISLAWAGKPAARTPGSARAAVFVAVPAALLLVLGLWTPEPLRQALSAAAAAVSGVRP